MIFSGMEINTKYVTIAQKRGLPVTLGQFFVQDPPWYCNTFFFYTYWSLNVNFVDRRSRRRLERVAAGVRVWRGLWCEGKRVSKWVPVYEAL